MNISHTLINLLINYIELNDLVLPQKLSNTMRTIRQGDSLSYPLWCDLLAQVSQCINKPELGIELGELAEAEHGGIVAYLVSSCDTLRDAMEYFQRFQTLLYGGEGEVIEVGDQIRVSWSNDLATSKGTQISDEVLIIGLVSFIKHIVDHPINLIRTYFIHSKPEYAKSYEKFLGNSISYACNTLMIEFPKKYLALPINNPEPVLKNILNQQAESLLKQSSNQLDTSVQDKNDFNSKLKQELIQCIKESNMSLEALSARMNISSRTLHRRLRQQGHNFNQLLKDTRLELAKEYLKEPDIRLAEVSHRLGYTEQSAFSRAFKQWTGMTPKQFINK